MARQGGFDMVGFARLVCLGPSAQPTLDRDAVEAAASHVRRMQPGMTEDAVLAITEATIRDDRPDRSLLEARIVGTYQHVVAAKRAGLFLQ